MRARAFRAGEQVGNGIRLPDRCANRRFRSTRDPDRPKSRRCPRIALHLDPDALAWQKETRQISLEHLDRTPSGIDRESIDLVLGESQNIREFRRDLADAAESGAFGPLQQIRLGVDLGQPAGSAASGDTKTAIGTRQPPLQRIGLPLDMPPVIGFGSVNVGPDFLGHGGFILSERVCELDRHTDAAQPQMHVTEALKRYGIDSLDLHGPRRTAVRDRTDVHQRDGAIRFGLARVQT